MTATSALQAIQLVAGLAAELCDSPGPADVLDHSLSLAIELVPGCEQAGISLVENGMIDTPASVGSIAAQCDKLQEALAQGPCISALAEASVIRIDDLAGDDRWPDFAAEAARLGVASMLACRLATPRDKLGALNLYATTAGAFDETSEHMAVAYASHVSFALSALEREVNLRRALDSREVIGQAMGILMERHRVTASQAFDVMVQASQRANLKLRLIAEELVRTGLLRQP